LTSCSTRSASWLSSVGILESASRLTARLLRGLLDDMFVDERRNLCMRLRPSPPTSGAEAITGIVALSACSAVRAGEELFARLGAEASRAWLIDVEDSDVDDMLADMPRMRRPPNGGGGCWASGSVWAVGPRGIRSATRAEWRGGIELLDRVSPVPAPSGGRRARAVATCGAMPAPGCWSGGTAAVGLRMLPPTETG
jgi:hypothetical protein